ncbi:hypothetical protein U1839_17920 [Sphingomonas sp. RT2P30]|uniref:hypothetical protein n=1 Tax=Parasphingomonas halimpatiens TaxID=3096162 RepID=UPI002FCBB580
MITTDTGEEIVSFLSEAEIDSLRVERMIIHLIGKQIEFKREPETQVQQEVFFRARIIEQAASAVHRFTEHSNVQPVLRQMGSGAIDFEAGGQELARLFSHDHAPQSTPGAFFVFQIATSIDDDTLYALIKYDYRAVVELAQKDGQNVLREIIQAFVKERRAVQKFCLARYRGGNVEELVSATDRMAEAPDLTDYFENFLGVSRARSTEELSARLNEALRSSFQGVRDYLPNRNVGAALARAKQALQGRGIITNDDVVDAVLHGAERPHDEEVIAQIERVTRSKLKRGNLTDVAFRPDPGTLDVQPRRKVRTAEDVRLEFPEEELGRTVFHQETAEGDVFTVRTSRELVENDTVAIRTR